MDECGNPMDYDVIWESKEIEDCKKTLLCRYWIAKFAEEINFEMSPMLKYIKNEQHYDLLVEAIRQVRRTLWIGTADLKDLYIKEGKEAVPLLKLLERKVKEGIEIRLIHAKELGKNFRDDFDKYPLL